MPGDELTGPEKLDRELDRERTEIRASGDRADRKAQILLTLTGVVLGLSVGAVGRWADDPSTSWSVISFAYTSLVLLGFSITLLMLVVRPDLGKGTALEESSWNRILLESEDGSRSAETGGRRTKFRAAVNRYPHAVKGRWLDVMMGAKNDEQAEKKGRELLDMITAETAEDRHLRYAIFAFELAKRTRVKHWRISWAMAAMFAGTVSIGIASILHG